MVRGDVLYGNATPNWARLPKGTDGYVLASGATDVAWATPKVAVANEIADATCYVGFFTDASGNLTAKTNANLTFDASTGIITAAGFTGPSTMMAVTSPTNLVRNGGAEDGTTYWYKINDVGSDGDISAYAADFYSGSASLRFVRTVKGGWGSIFYNQLNEYLPSPYFNTGLQYTINFWTKSLSGAARTLSVMISDVDGTDVVANFGAVTIPTAWTRFSFTFTPALAGVAPVLYFGPVEDAIDVLIDNVQLNVGTQALGYCGLQMDCDDNAHINADLNVAEGHYYRYGSGVLAYAQTALHNYFFGSAGNLTTTGAAITAIGDTAGANLGAGADNNTMIGGWAGCNCTTGVGNTFVGVNAGAGAAGAYAGAGSNAAVGLNALYQITTNSSGNSALGTSAGFNSSTGTHNVFVGMEAGYGVGGVYTGANNNVCVGYQSGYSFVNGSGANSIVGDSAGRSYAGSGLSAFGYACAYVTTGAENAMFGYRAGACNSTGIGNTFMGFEAGFGSTNPYAGSNYNTAVGYRAGFDIGAAALNNTLVGALAGENLTTGDGNVFVGYQAGDSLTTSNYNVSVGYQSGFYNQTGTQNVFIGYMAGYGDDVVYTGSDWNVCIGGESGFNLQTGADGNVCIGFDSGYSLTTGDMNVFLGYAAGYNETTASNYLYIANTDAGLGSALLTGNFATESVGIGMVPSSITARLHLPAGGTAASSAPLKFIDGNTLATIEQGAVEMYKSTLWFQPCATLIKQSLDGTIFSQTTAVTAANVNVATTLVGAGRGDAASPINLPANFFVLAGKTIRVTARGYYGATGGGGPYTLVLTVRLVDAGGDAVVLQTAALAVTGRSNMGWEIQGDITCYATGAAGTFWGQGFATLASSTTTSDVLQMVNTAIDTNMDTTSAMTLDVQATWNTADAANSITCTNLIVESVD